MPKKTARWQIGSLLLTGRSLPRMSLWNHEGPYFLLVLNLSHCFRRSKRTPRCGLNEAISTKAHHRYPISLFQACKSVLMTRNEGQSPFGKANYCSDFMRARRPAHNIDRSPEISCRESEIIRCLKMPNAQRDSH